MRWTYEIESGSFYFFLADGRPARQREFNDGLIVDLDHTDNLVGVEYRLGAPGLNDPAFRELVGDDAARTIEFAVANPPAPVALPAPRVPTPPQSSVLVVQIKGPSGPRVGEAVAPNEVELQLQDA
jgi:hypothetical protein